MKQSFVVLMAVVVIGSLAGCVSRVEKTERLRNVEYSILEKNKIPKEMQVKIETLKHRPFEMTYRENDNLYIAQGYGACLTTGYSVAVLDVYETADAIHFISLLKGPEKQEKIKKISTFPYVVIKTNNNSKKVVFE